MKDLIRHTIVSVLYRIEIEMETKQTNKRNERVIKFIDRLFIESSLVFSSRSLYSLSLSISWCVRSRFLSNSWPRLFISCVLPINLCRFQINAYIQSGMWTHVKSTVDFIYFPFYDIAIRTWLTFSMLLLLCFSHSAFYLSFFSIVSHRNEIEDIFVRFRFPFSLLHFFAFIIFGSLGRWELILFT